MNDGLEAWDISLPGHLYEVRDALVREMDKFTTAIPSIIVDHDQFEEAFDLFSNKPVTRLRRYFWVKANGDA